MTSVPHPAPAEPGALGVGTDGSLRGSTGAYDKHLGDLRGCYRDAAAFDAAVASRGADSLVYRVEEHRCGDGPGALIFGTSTLLPGRCGREYAMTRGHLHRRADRAEVYHCLSGSGVMLLETLDGLRRVVPMTAGDAVHVPGHWVHRTVNTGPRPFVSSFTYPEDAGQDYTLIADAGGMAQLVVDDGAGGWASEPNPDHRGYRTAGERTTGPAGGVG